eukprot:scaffold8729_cov51-Cylindrotheca_fusiformis.AAC.1
MEHHEEAGDEAWIYTGQEKVPPTVRRVRIAENVTEIPEEAFDEHQELEEVILSSSVQVIGKEAFCWCRKMRSILYQGLEKEEAGIPSTVKVIGDSAFLGCRLLARLVLNEGLERIGKNAFHFCESLSHVRIPRSVNSLATAFTRCSSLISIELPEECPFNINLSRCLSLVSLAGQISILLQSERRREEFFQSSKLGSLVDDKDDLK